MDIVLSKIEKRKLYLKNYNREWMRKRRHSFFNGKTCTVCGSKERLELDHIIPALKEHHCIWSWSKERREKELVKCQVLCHQCHVKKTYNDRGFDFATHGRSSMYKYHHCFCDLCRRAYLEKRKKRDAEYRERNRKRKK